jgi:3'(2'), 5'-bisphosphate nucleotidase
VAQALNITHHIQRGSVGLKMVAIAAGEAHGYISFSTRMQEWDTCGPEAIVRAAGGHVTDILGHPLRYNKPIPITQTGFVATGGTEHAVWLDAAVKAIYTVRG